PQGRRRHAAGLSPTPNLARDAGLRSVRRSHATIDGASYHHPPPTSRPLLSYGEIREHLNPDPPAARLGFEPIPCAFLNQATFGGASRCATLAPRGRSRLESSV